MFMFATALRADERGERGGGGGGGGDGVHVNAPAAHVDAGPAHVNTGTAHVDGNAAHVDAGPAHVNANGGNANVNVDGRVNANVDQSVRGPNIGREAYVARNSHLGDQNFDRRGVGALDANRFANARDNNWRYRRWGNEWWYWLPTGSWMYYRDGRWNNYAYDSYVDYNQYQNQPVAGASSNGPYYEDQNGFYYFNGNQKVYDPGIIRQGSSVGAVPGNSPR
jgi:hypothetical protein